MCYANIKMRLHRQATVFQNTLRSILVNVWSRLN